MLREWNLQHGAQCGARVELVNWRTHTRPAAGGRPQALINRQAFDACDVVVAIFWARFGSPTGRAASGTVEEIERGIKQRKQVLVYFCNRPTQGTKTGRARVERFRRDFGAKALYCDYSDVGSFERLLRSHLAATMNDLLKRRS